MQRRTHAPSASPPSAARRRFGLSATTSFMASAWHVTCSSTAVVPCVARRRERPSMTKKTMPMPLRT
eukprot:1977633-Prymnesium_polylepis.1